MKTFILSLLVLQLIFGAVHGQMSTTENLDLRIKEQEKELRSLNERLIRTEERLASRHHWLQILGIGGVSGLAGIFILLHRQVGKLASTRFEALFKHALQCRVLFGCFSC